MRPRWTPLRGSVWGVEIRLYCGVCVETQSNLMLYGRRGRVFERFAYNCVWFIGLAAQYKI